MSSTTKENIKQKQVGFMNARSNLTVICLFLGACQNATQIPLATIPNRQVEVYKITLGIVQSNIQKGSSSASVIDTLGSPNIITTNTDGTETWIYDKISLEQEAVASNNSGIITKSTRTLLVAIKFDSTKKVEEVKYRQTSY